MIALEPTPVLGLWSSAIIFDHFYYWSKHSRPLEIYSLSDPSVHILIHRTQLMEFSAFKSRLQQCATPIMPPLEDLYVVLGTIQAVLSWTVAILTVDPGGSLPAVELTLAR